MSGTIARVSISNEATPLLIQVFSLVPILPRVSAEILGVRSIDRIPE